MVGKTALYKLVVLGDGKVGKTALTIQLCLQNFVETYDPTFEDIYRKQVQIDGTSCMLEILNSAGREEYTSLQDQWIREGEAFMLIYSISSRTSFERIRWFHDQIIRVKQSKVIMCLVGTQCDRVTEREVSTQEGFSLAKELACDFFEVSSKSGVNVEASFYGLVREMHKQAEIVLQNPEPPRILRYAAKLSQTWRRPQPWNQKSTSFPSMTRYFHSPNSQFNKPGCLDATQQMSLNRLLVQMAQRDNRKTTKRLLQIGADPNGDSCVAGSPLYAAAAVGHSKMVTLLLDSGAAVNAKSTRGATPLIVAAAEGHIAVVEILLARGASTDAQNETHGTPLIGATFRCHAKVLKALILHNANVNIKGGRYDTALHTVATVGNAHIANILLEAGADVTLRDRDNCTALQVAAAAGHAGVVRLLLLKGNCTLINDTQGKYGSALKAANDRSRFDVMKVLLAAGASEETLNVLSTPASTRSDDSVSKICSSIRAASEEDDSSATGLEDDLSVTCIDSVPPGTPKSTQGTVEHDVSSEVASSGSLNRTNADQNQNADRKSSPLGDLVLNPSILFPDEDLIYPVQHQTPSLGLVGAVNNQKPEIYKPQNLSDSLDQLKGPSIVEHYEYSNTQMIPWNPVSRLGHGSYSTIEEIEHTDISQQNVRYARKSFLVPPHSRRRFLPVIHNEVNILKALRHHHVVQIHSTYRAEREFAIIMSPVAEMNLGEYLFYNSRPSGDSPIYSWFGCLATAFDYLHERKIKHQDVKPSNILIRDSQVVVADFGISKDVLNEATTGSMGPDARTLMYCAPEVAAEEIDSRHGRSADIFSLGCVFLEIVTALLWVHGSSIEKLHDLIREDQRRVYSASLTKVLQWILMLYAFARTTNEPTWNATSGRSTKASCTQALQWCLAMLLVDSDARITAHELKIAINQHQGWRLKNSILQNVATSPSWVGSCCALFPEDLEVSVQPRVMGSWPDLTLDAATLGYAPWSWDDIKRLMVFRADEKHRN